MEETNQNAAETVETVAPTVTPTPTATSAEAVAEALGASTAVAVADETPEEPQVDPTGRLDDPGKTAFHWGTGRRKESVARVRIRPGSGQISVNGKDMNVYFSRLVDHEAVVAPLVTLKVRNKVDVFVNTHGGGSTGQAGAVRMGLGRALMGLYPDASESMRIAGHLSRDSRMVERKKYGRHGARRGHQWGKR
jgi:small subunit ribosomal protein S9